MRGLACALRALWLSVLVVACGCGGNGGTSFFDGGPGDGANGRRDATLDGGGSTDAMIIKLFDGSGSAEACVGLACQQTCATTSISGRVFDPAGLIPLYNVFVYVPNGPLDPITTGPVCTACQAPATGNPIASTTSGTDGSFMIPNAPSGTNIPVVLQLGKWRRHLTIPTVTACMNTAPADPFFRFPTKQAETSPDDNIPLIAFTTGCDGAECFLNGRVGIDISEFTPPTGTGRVHVYKSANDDGQTFPMGAGVADNLWLTDMMQYDIVFDACECSTYERGATPTGYVNFLNYLNAGGRAFTTHYYYNFFADSAQCEGDPTCQGQTPLPTVGAWEMNADHPFANGAFCPNDPKIPVGAGGPGSCMTIDTTIPKGKSFAGWYAYNNPQLMVGGGESYGFVGLMDLREDMGELESSLVMAGTATPWLYAGDLTTGYDAYYFSVNTPVGTDATTQCGRAIFSDVHVAGSGGEVGTGETVPAGTFPNYCAANPNAANHAPNELALEFLFFDLSSCVQNDTQPPPPPPQPK
jgi:hypothetical protein